MVFKGGDFEFEINVNEFCKTIEGYQEGLKEVVKRGVSTTVNALRDKTIANAKATPYRLQTSSGLHAKNKLAPKYKTPLLEGITAYVKKSDTDATNSYGALHILGNRLQDDGTWRLRFFELGTHSPTRRKGRGNIVGKHFFGNAVANANTLCQTIVQALLTKKINELNAKKN